MLTEKQKQWLGTTPADNLTLALMKMLKEQKIRVDKYLEIFTYWFKKRGYEFYEDFGWLKPEEKEEMGIKKINGKWYVGDPSKMTAYLEKQHRIDFARTKESDELLSYIDDTFGTTSSEEIIEPDYIIEKPFYRGTSEPQAFGIKADDKRIFKDNFKVQIKGYPQIYIIPSLEFVMKYPKDIKKPFLRVVELKDLKAR